MFKLKTSILALLLLFSNWANGQQAAGPLTNQRIIDLVKAGVRQDELGRIISTAPQVSFNLTPVETQTLMNAGVTEETIKQMAARELGVQYNPGVAAVPGGQVQSLPTSTPNAAGQTSTNGYVYQGKGMWDAGFLGSAEIPHSSAADTTGVVSGEAGYFVSRGSLIGGSVTGVFNRGAQDVFLSGGYRYFFGSAMARARPYAGAAAGVNLLTGSGASDVRFLAVGGAGVRYFVAPHVAIDFGYGLYYEHIQGATFAQSTLSAITVGFAHVFGNR